MPPAYGLPRPGLPTIGLRVGDRVLAARVASPTTLGFNPAEKRDHDGKWTDGGPGGDTTPGGPARTAEVGRAAFAEAEPANSPDQVVAVMRKHRQANPDVTTADLIAAADAAIEAKYPQHPQIKGFYTKLLQGRTAEIDAPAPAGKPSKAKPSTAKPKTPATPKPLPAPKPAPKAADTTTVTAKQAQELQDSMPPPWTGDQRKALRYYTGNSAVANGLLRGWIRPPGRTQTEQRKIEAAQRNMAAAVAGMRPTPKPLTVFRATGPDQFNVANLADLDNLVGHDLTDAGFMSTTTNKSFRLQGKVKMEIEVPEGTPMAFVKSVSKYPYEDEVLLPPGSRYQVISVEQGRGRATVRVRVVA